MLNLLNQQEQVWRNRYALVKGGVDQEKIDAWKQELEAGKVKIERAVRLQESYQNSLQPQITSLEKQLSDQGYSKDLRRELENRLGVLRTLERGGVEYLSMLQATLRLNQRLLDEITHKSKHFDLWKKLTALKLLRNSCLLSLLSRPSLVSNRSNWLTIICLHSPL